MKNLFLILISISVFFFIGCDKNENEIVEDSYYLVDKIYDYHNNLIGDYIYDGENRLTKVMIFFYDTEEGRQIDYDFAYKKNRVISIKYIEYKEPQFNHIISLTYNNSGQIIKSETYLIDKEIIVGREHYNYSENGNLESISDDNGDSYYYFFYDENKNVTKIKYLVYNRISGKLDEVYKHFAYDNMPKPDFGIDNLFMIEPYPGRGAEGMERRLSANNMTEVLDGVKTKWIYAYNENNLPQTIETKWDGIDTQYPMIQRIKYRKIK